MINEIHEKYQNLKIQSTDKIIVSSLNALKFDLKKINNQKIDFKPRGIWYGCGTSWMDWIESEMPDWQHDNVYKLELKSQINY